MRRININLMVHRIKTFLYVNFIRVFIPSDYSL